MANEGKTPGNEYFSLSQVIEEGFEDSKASDLSSVRSNTNKKSTANFYKDNKHILRETFQPETFYNLAMLERILQEKHYFNLDDPSILLSLFLLAKQKQKKKASELIPNIVKASRTAYEDF